MSTVVILQQKELSNIHCQYPVNRPVSALNLRANPHWPANAAKLYPEFVPVRFWIAIAAVGETVPQANTLPEVGEVQIPFILS